MINITAVKKITKITIELDGEEDGMAFLRDLEAIETKVSPTTEAIQSKLRIAIERV